MKKILFSVSILLVCLSCCQLTPNSDPADAFVGLYSYTDDGYDNNGAFALEGTFSIAKESANQIMITGSSWVIFGIVKESCIVLSPYTSSSINSIINYTFGNAILNDNRLTFTYCASGYCDGVGYECNGVISAVKDSDFNWYSESK